MGVCPVSCFQKWNFRSISTLREHFFACVCGCAALHFCRHFRSFLRFPFAAVAYWKIECGLPSASLLPFLSPFPCFWQLSFTPFPSISVVSVYSLNFFQSPLFCFISLPWIGGSCFFHAQAFILPVANALSSSFPSPPFSSSLPSSLLHHFTAFPLCCVVLFRLWLTSLPSLLFLPICHLPSPLSLRSFGFIIPVIQSHLFRWTFRFISV